MFFYLPGELVSLFTFPGVVLHEIAHRFFCDLTHTPVYGINYFVIDEKVAGRVIHGQPTKWIYKFLISIGPLIINTIVCMMFTFPYGCKHILNIGTTPFSESLGYYIITWIGFSVGFHAIPSNQDMKGLSEEATNIFAEAGTLLLSGIIWLFNVDYIGPIFKFAFVIWLSQQLPKYYLNHLFKFFSTAGCF